MAAAVDLCKRLRYSKGAESSPWLMSRSSIQTKSYIIVPATVGACYMAPTAHRSFAPVQPQADKTFRLLTGHSRSENWPSRQACSIL